MPPNTPKAVLTVLGLLGLIVTAPSIWYAAQRSYTDFRCTGAVNEQGRCVEDPRDTGVTSATVPAGASDRLNPRLSAVTPLRPAIAATGGTPPMSTTPGPPPAAPLDTNLDPIALLNIERQRAGLGSLREEGPLAAAANAHARYMVQNRTLGHEEAAGMPGFLGRTPQERMRTMGYGAGAQRVGTGEVLATLGGDTGDAVSNLMAAIYHRVIMLDPAFQDAGTSVVVNGDSLVVVLDLGVKDNIAANTPVRLVLYPTPYQENVPTTFLPGHEMPNPVPERARVGYPISVEVASGHALSITGMALRDASGALLPTKVLSATTDREFRPNEWAFIPWDPLRPAQRYDVTLDGAVDGQPFHTQWGFVTANAVVFQALADQPVLRPGEQTWVHYSKTDASAWQVSIHTEGASALPLQVVQQSWRGLVVQAMPGCEQTEGCRVQVTVTDDQGRVAQVPLRVSMR